MCRQISDMICSLHMTHTAQLLIKGGFYETDSHSCRFALHRTFAWHPFANKVTPYLFGMPFILAYVVIWALLTSVLMAIVYVLDKENKREEAE